jgi:ACS family tartrate transporter-like MFS transporter
MSSPTIATVPAIAPSAPNDADLARATIRRVTARLLPFLAVLWLFNWIDRTNLAIAALQMKQDLHFSATAYGFGGGIFFLGYALCEIPSNLILVRVGARRWIARIAITWGLIASAMMFVRTPSQFYALRFLLGVAEAGFFPGVIYYLSLWFPARERGLTSARFMIAGPLSGVVGNLLGGWVLGFDGRLGLHGWQWLFLLEGIPSVVLGVMALSLLTDRPEDAQWLSNRERDWLVARMRRDADESTARHVVTPIRALSQPLLWLLALTGFLNSVGLWSYALWAPLVVRDALDTTILTTGIIVATIAGFAATGMIVNGVHSDRTGERCVHAGAGAAIAAAGWVGAALLPTSLARVGALALTEVGARVFMVPFICLPVMLLRGSAAAAGIAFVMAVFSLGGFAGPTLVGWFKDTTGSTSGAFLVLAGVSLTAAALCLALRWQLAFALRARTNAM